MWANGILLATRAWHARAFGCPWGARDGQGGGMVSDRRPEEEVRGRSTGDGREAIQTYAAGSAWIQQGADNRCGWLTGFARRRRRRSVLQPPRRWADSSRRRGCPGPWGATPWAPTSSPRWRGRSCTSPPSRRCPSSTPARRAAAGVIMVWFDVRGPPSLQWMVGDSDSGVGDQRGPVCERGARDHQVALPDRLSKQRMSDLSVSFRRRAVEGKACQGSSPAGPKLSQYPSGHTGFSMGSHHSCGPPSGAAPPHRFSAAGVMESPPVWMKSTRALRGMRPSSTMPRSPANALAV